MLRDTLKYLVTQLSDKDRLSIVSFDSSVSYVCGLQRGTAERKAQLEGTIDRHPDLQARGGTTIWYGVEAALQLLTARKTQNPVSSILLLTDGQDSGAVSHIPEMVQRLPQSCVVHTFGYGSDHEVGICSGYAEAGHGTFTYIEQLDQVYDAFATVLGGLLSVVAQNLTLTVTPASAGVQVTAVRTHYKSTLAPEGALATVNIPDMFEGERRDIVVKFLLPPIDAPVESQPLATLSLVYTRPGVAEAPISSQGAVCIARPPKVIDPGFNAEVDQQCIRFDVIDIIQRAMALAESHQTTQAQQLLQAQIDSIRTGPQASSPMAAALLSDLIECQRRVESYDSGGKAFFMQAKMQHAQQRATSSTPSPSSAMYFTPGQMQQQAAVTSYRKRK
jgi:hypothetical protein